MCSVLISYRNILKYGQKYTFLTKLGNMYLAKSTGILKSSLVGASFKPKALSFLIKMMSFLKEFLSISSS